MDCLHAWFLPCLYPSVERIPIVHVSQNQNRGRQVFAIHHDVPLFNNDFNNTLFCVVLKYCFKDFLQKLKKILNVILVTIVLSIASLQYKTNRITSFVTFSPLISFLLHLNKMNFEWTDMLCLQVSFCLC